MGQELATAVAAEPPMEFHWSGKPDQLYTVLMVDPDAPSRSDPSMRSFLHWAIVNCPGEERDRGDTIAEYTGPAPPPGSGLHRYVFIVYQQTAKADVSKLDKIGASRCDTGMRSTLRCIVNLGALFRLSGRLAHSSLLHSLTHSCLAGVRVRVMLLVRRVAPASMWRSGLDPSAGRIGRWSVRQAGSTTERIESDRHGRR